ncbi:Oxidoreductase htatip2 [Coemansia sp. RSA 1822]|nr:Oxidoreductase htatip2 [Coemansia sp. RSA 638]KAJ2122359.1 Oxidoreductase htatip2 [Coemansia sp. RSA 720]KAJ2541503.1 Oxidoreductase htatip2 [Coemansia sp. RSA 1853]KAJ2561263.1 Oxidoreductase htatip2 [Coemansia sp. RSA 1822]
MSDAVKIVVDDKLALGEPFTKAASEFKARSPGKSALVLGSTGEVGREVVKHLMASNAFDKVTVLARRPIEYTGPNAEKLEQKPADFENTEQLERDFAGHTHAFSCLGTTRSKNGKDAFYKVDHDYALNAAKAAKTAGVEHYSNCSSNGADKNSMFLYMKTKGEVDSEIQDMGFPRVSIFRPSMLLCDRKEARLLEKAASYVMPLLDYVMPSKMSIPTSTVAWAMVNNTFKKVDTPIAELLTNKQMLDEFKKSQ